MLWISFFWSKISLRIFLNEKSPCSKQKRIIFMKGFSEHDLLLVCIFAGYFAQHSINNTINWIFMLFTMLHRAKTSFPILLYFLKMAWIEFSEINCTNLNKTECNWYVVTIFCWDILLFVYKNTLFANNGFNFQ